ncbi:MAG: hypothetical protein R3175_13395 [Marinobacter sp.]|nr:hypothetical protein [Marinobacter sp.]MDX1757051.1 hypothetical protein [Marinobacter sp.]
MLLTLTRGMARYIITMAAVLAEREGQLHRAYPMEVESRRQTGAPAPSK